MKLPIRILVVITWLVSTTSAAHAVPFANALDEYSCGWGRVVLVPATFETATDFEHWAVDDSSFDASLDDHFPTDAEIKLSSFDEFAQDDSSFDDWSLDDSAFDESGPALLAPQAAHPVESSSVTNKSPEQSVTKPEPSPAAAPSQPIKPKVAAPSVPAEPHKLPAGASAAQPWSAEAERLRQRIVRVMDLYHPKRLNSQDNNTWEMMHSIIGFGVRSEIYRHSSHSDPVNTVAYLCYNYPAQGQRLFYLDRGRVTAKIGVGVQGHAAQFLAMMAQSRVSLDYPMQVEGKELKLADLLETEKLTCQAGTELTFKLISFSHYLDTEQQWKCDAGQTWSISRLIQEEIKAPIRGAACGGTHRLTGLSYAVRKRQIEQRPIDGQFLRAQKYLNDYHNYLFSLQNADGSFSTEWFTRRGDRDDLDRRLQTTGHMLEWLVFSLPEDQLDDRRVLRSVEYLSSLLLNGQHRKWEIGPLGHAIHALSIYNQRRFRTPKSVAGGNLAAESASSQPLATSGDQPAAKTADRRRDPVLSGSVVAPTPPADDSLPIGPGIGKRALPSSANGSPRMLDSAPPSSNSSRKVLPPFGSRRN